MPKVTRQTRTKRGKTGIAARIKPVSFGTDGLKCCIYGRSGTGKTTIACTFPKPLLIIGAEDGTKSVHNVKGVELAPLNDSSEFSEVVDIVREGKYKTAVVDSSTSLQDLVLKDILGVDELPAQKSWGMASREQWGQCALQVKEYLRAIIGLCSGGLNVVIAAQERAFNSDDESSDSLVLPYVGAALTPSVTGWLNPACDYVMHTFIRQRVRTKTIKVGKRQKEIEEVVPGEVDYCLRIGADPVYTTKFRAPIGEVKPHVITDPSYQKIVSLIKGK